MKLTHAELDLVILANIQAFTKIKVVGTTTPHCQALVYQVTV